MERHQLITSLQFTTGQNIHFLCNSREILFLTSIKNVLNIFQIVKIKSIIMKIRGYETKLEIQNMFYNSFSWVAMLLKK